jgi:hypothetical protein
MATNKLPQSPIERILSLAEDMADGASTHGTPIGLLQNTETAIRADLTAAQTAESLFQAARANKSAKSAAQQIADSNAKAFIAATKKILSLTLGNAWSTEWAAAGWNTPTLAIPASVPERLATLPAIATYLTANPVKENAPAAVTAANAQALHAALSTAISGVHTANVASGQAKATRDAALEKLRQRMSGLVRELEQLLKDDDARWYAFGLNRPEDPETPAIAAGLVATPGAPGVLLLDWADARRAERYKVETKKTGDADFTEAAQVTDSEATLTALPTGATLTIRVLSANAAGYAQPSEELVVTVQ